MNPVPLLISFYLTNLAYCNLPIDLKWLYSYSSFISNGKLRINNVLLSRFYLGLNTLLICLFLIGTYSLGSSISIWPF